MCINPTILPDGVLVGCRKCWQCRGRKIDDWVGRCIAEGKTCTHTHSVTLTYGRDENNETDHIRAAVLTYSDIQKYFKRLRKSGYRFRYLVAGEYGTAKGRAHWHLVLFWQGDHPEIELEKRFNEKHWPHGYSFFETIRNGDIGNSAAVKYVCKYILKDQKDENANGHFSMSKKPPIGYDYFMDLAQQYVDNGLAPQDLHYSFPEVTRNGKPKKFMMTGAVAEKFKARFILNWLTQREGFIPSSELIQEYQDSLVQEDLRLAIFERKNDGRQAQAEYELYLEKAEIPRHENVEAIFSVGNPCARLNDGTLVYRKKKQVQEGIDLTLSKRSPNKPKRA